MTVLEATAPAAARPGERALRRAGSLAPVAGILLGVPACWWIAVHAHPGHLAHEVALFGHLASLLLGFGAVLSVDWVGLLWVLGRRTFDDVLATAGHVTLAIWLGYAGLVASGLFLEPDLTRPLTRLKLVLVVVIGLNGLLATALHRRLCDQPSTLLLVVSSTSAGLSQLGWWGCVVIGHVNTR